MPRILAAFLPFAFALLAGSAQAQSCTATVEDVDFGRAPLTAAHVDASAMLRVTCVGLPLVTAVKICPSLGAGSGGAVDSARRLAGPAGAELTYQLYQDAGRTVPWGAVDAPELGTVPAIILSPTLTGVASASRTLHARLFAGQQAAPPGSYSALFAGASAAFTLAPFLFGASGGCTGFVGTQVLHPEFTVRATPAAACSVTASDLAFPAAGVLSTALLAQTTLYVTCTGTTPYSVGLDNGRNGSDPGARRMLSVTGAGVTYALHRDAARSQPWGGLAEGLAVTATGTGQAQAHTVYGRVPAQATPAPGGYSDRVTITVTY